MTKLYFNKPKKQKPGTRAGLDRAKIADVALKLFFSAGPAGFTIDALAKQLKVVPTTIRAHFKGGARELLDEIVRNSLAELAPPYKPQQDPETYLLDSFRSCLTTFRQNPALGRLVAHHLSDAPLLSPVFAERMCSTLEALVGAKLDLAHGLEALIGCSAGQILIETGAWARADAKAAGAMVSESVSALSKGEFPTLHGLAVKFGDHLLKRTKPDYVEEAAKRAVAAVVVAAKAGPPGSK